VRLDMLECNIVKVLVEVGEMFAGDGDRVVLLRQRV